MAWYLGDIRIYVTEISDVSSNIIARLQPIDADTILHHFGWESDIYHLTGFVITDTDKDALKAYSKTSTAYSLSGPEGAVGDMYVKEFKAQRQLTTCVRMLDRPALDGTEPFYQVSMELYT